MKRKIFSVLAIATIALVSCKKDELNTTELGSATINGNIWADLDMTASGVEGVEGMEVKIEVNTQDWDQQSVVGYDYDKKVYTATTNASGDYSFTLPATDDGYNVTMEYQDVYTTRTGSDGTVQDVVVSRANITKFIYSGANITTVDEGEVDVWNATSYGMATIKGIIYVDADGAFWDGNTSANVPLTTSAMTYYNLPTGMQVLWAYGSGNEPYNITDQVVRMMNFDPATGEYELTIPTEMSGMSDIYVNYGMNDFEGQKAISNVAGTADSMLTGYYSNSQIFSYADWLYDGQIQNTDMYFSFTEY